MAADEATAEAPAATEFDAEIKDLGDKIAGLSLKQAVDLKEYLKETYGLEPAAGGAVMMAGPAAGGDDGGEEEKTEFDVILIGFGDKKIQVIKEVRGITGLGLKEAKELVEGVPKPIKEGVPQDEANEIKEKIEGAGGQVDVK